MPTLKHNAPPSFFKRTAGIVKSSRPVWEKTVQLGGDTPLKGKYTQAQLAGLRYERKVQEHLLLNLKHYISHLPFAFFDDEIANRQIAIPDGLAFAEHHKLITIIEIKRTHRTDAWWQLEKLYLPVVSKAFPGALIKLLEVCQNYDPSVQLTAPKDFVQDIRSWTEDMTTQTFGIYNWTGKT